MIQSIALVFLNDGTLSVQQEDFESTGESGLFISMGIRRMREKEGEETDEENTEEQQSTTLEETSRVLLEIVKHLWTRRLDY